MNEIIFQKQQELAKEKPFLNTEMGQYVFQLGFEHGYKFTIDKACEWLENNLINYWSQCNANNTKDFISDFKKAMEE